MLNIWDVTQDGSKGRGGRKITAITENTPRIFPRAGYPSSTTVGQDVCAG